MKRINTATTVNGIFVDGNRALGKKVDVSAMSAYATSAWVEDNFLKHSQYAVKAVDIYSNL